MSKFINEAGWDRIARVVLGLVLLAIGLGGLMAAPWGIVIAVVGLILLITGLIGFCPLYRLFNFHTN